MTTRIVHKNERAAALGLGAVASLAYGLAVAAEPADYVFRNGTVCTMDAPRSRAGHLEKRPQSACRTTMPGAIGMSSVDRDDEMPRFTTTWRISMTRLFRTSLLVALTLLPVAFSPAAQAQSEQQQLVAKAETSLSNFGRDPDMTWFQQNVGRAKAVLIAPEVLKAGFIFGGSGGNAVLIAKDPASGKWIGPAFYTLATASVGFQAGIAVSEVVTLVMTDKGMNSLLSSSFKIGGDATVAAGPVGAGAKADIVADLVSFSRSKGVYGGLNLDGTVVKTSDSWNDAYFGKKVLPPDILVRANVSNKDADKLIADVTKLAGGK